MLLNLNYATIDKYEIRDKVVTIREKNYHFIYREACSIRQK